MTKHEQAFRAVYPKATIERQKTGDGRRYYLVRKEFRTTMYSGCGDTKAQAWRDAAAKLPPATTATHSIQNQEASDVTPSKS